MVVLKLVWICWKFFFGFLCWLIGVWGKKLRILVVLFVLLCNIVKLLLFGEVSIGL